MGIQNVSNFRAPVETVGVVGAGAMGRGIAQIAAQAGLTVWLFDANSQAVADGVSALTSTWSGLVSKGKLTQGQADASLARVKQASTLNEFADCDLVVEAIVERLDAKQGLFTSLESIVRPDCILASNTSSLSITAIAAACQRPERVAGWHFFNPVPLMKVVEVIPGLKSDPSVVHALSALSKRCGHTPVVASDTPGFIVNHAGRGFGTEALRLVGESVVSNDTRGFATVDRILKDQVGFRLGPFELMDLTALDVSHPVMESIFRQYYDEPRYRPSVITAQRLAGGALGRKSGSGFYAYPNGSQETIAEPTVPARDDKPVWVHPKAARRQEIYAILKAMGATIETGARPSESALILTAPLGFDCTTLCAVEQLDASRTVALDMLFADSATKRRVLMTNPATADAFRDSAHALLASDGKSVSVTRDSAGFVTQRVVATIVNIACDICQQGICSPADLETAVRLGLGYPNGPLALGDALGPASILEVLFNMQTVYGDPRYRPSPWLRRRAALGLSLLHVEA
jgi:3-hydroxybutyryl-CoA dehydrogenase